MPAFLSGMLLLCQWGCFLKICVVRTCGKCCTYCPSCERVIINDSEKSCSEGNLFSVEKKKICRFSHIWACGILFLLSISLRKTIFEKTGLRTVAHSYCIFYRMKGNPSCLVFRRLCGGRLLMAYFQNSRFLFLGRTVYSGRQTLFQ